MKLKMITTCAAILAIGLATAASAQGTMSTPGGSMAGPSNKSSMGGSMMMSKKPMGHKKMKKSKSSMKSGATKSGSSMQSPH